MTRQSLGLKVNGTSHALELEPHRSLLNVLREDLGLTGTKKGCHSGHCGACTVLLDGAPVNACMVLAVQADGHEVTTIEGVAVDGQLHPLQEAFIEYGASQCGYCTPGMVLNSIALLRETPRPTRSEIQEALAGNLCRCTGYVQIIEAIQSVANGSK
ncbi:MAG: (2Fe-2S)-binding protein [Rhodocyclaceae bacterium]|nr:MAG: (2Fe-2S)-binding protein [Rhodocyclaceae bacterium]